MVSGKALLEERLKAYEVGADDYVTKPFSDDELLAKIQVFLRLKTIEEVDSLKTRALEKLSRNTVNPLTGIILPLADLLDDEGIENETVRQKLVDCYGNAVNLRQFFEKLVLHGAIKSGTLKLNFLVTDLCEMVRKTISIYESKLVKKKVTIRQVLPEKALVKLDTLEFNRVLETILGNAIQFSPVNARIIVEISEAGEYFYLSFLDQGDGLKVKNVMDTDTELSQFETKKDNPKWHGLSLSLANLIVSKHQGRIEIDSLKGTGTNITIKLPRTMDSEQSSFDLDTAIMPNVAL